MRLILIRHAVTSDNGRCYIGHRDVELSCQGHRQARHLAEKIADIPVEAIFSSRLRRAFDTAWPIARSRGLEISQWSELQELDFGHLEGTQKAGHKTSIRRTYLAEPIPGGEALLDVHQRLGAVRRELEKRMIAGQTVAVVGHYWSNRILLAGMMYRNPVEGLAKMKYKPAHASALEISFSARHEVLSLAETDWLLQAHPAYQDPK